MKNAPQLCLLFLCLLFFSEVHSFQTTKHSHSFLKSKFLHNRHHKSKKMHLLQTESKTKSKISLGSATNVAIIMKYCYQGIVDSIPPAFCWKATGSSGVPATNCPSGTTYLDQYSCLTNCQSGYRYDVGTQRCWQSCQSNEYTIGFYCYAGWDSYMQGSYYPTIVSPTCDSGFYKLNNLCYPDCEKIEMVNCGVGACTASLTECILNVINVIINVAIAVASSIPIIFTIKAAAQFTAAPAVATAKQAVTSFTKSFFTKVLKYLGRFFPKLLASATKKATFIKQVVGKVMRYKEFNEYVVSTGLAWISTASLYPICEQTAQYLSQKVAGTEEPDVTFGLTWENLDFAGLIPTYKTCSEIEDYSYSIDPEVRTTDANELMACAKGVVNILSYLDPTGWLCVITALMHPYCYGI